MKNMPQDYNKLKVYQEAFFLATDIYNSLKGMNKDFRIKEQLTASVTAIFANLAEMAAFESKGQIRQKVITCIAEANETEAWLDYCSKVSIIEQAQYKDLVERIRTIRKMLYSLLKSME